MQLNIDTGRRRFAGLLGVALMSVSVAMTACGGNQDEPEMGGMDDMPGMAGQDSAAMGGMMTTERMREHMDQMAAVPPDSMQAMMPMHRQMVGNMMARMNREMGQMNMPADSAWTATVDSLRADLTRMPDMDAEELQALMPAHRERVERLISMHESMMGGMAR